MPVWRRGWVNLGLLSLIVGALIAMAELDRLLGSVADTQGRAWTISGLVGLSRLADWSPDGWQAAVGPDIRAGYRAWARASLGLDTLMIGAYAALLAARLGLRRWRWWLPLPVADLTENLVASGIALGAGEQGAATYLVPWLSLVKWLALLWLMLRVGVTLIGPSGLGWRRAVLRARRAVFIHRFSLIAIIPLAALGLVPGSGLSDQLPDVQRAWTNDGMGIAQGVCAALALLALSIGIFVVGRMRSDFAYRATRPGFEDARPQPSLAPYLVGPALVGVGALCALASGGQVLWARVAVFAGVPIAVVLGSVWARSRDWPRPPRKGLDPGDVSAISATGDILTVLPVAIGGLTLVRSFTAPIALGAVTATPALLATGGLAIAVGCWWAAARLGLRLSASSAAPSPGRTGDGLAEKVTVGAAASFSARAQWSFMAILMVLLVTIYLFPLLLAGAGVIVVAVVGVGVICLLVGSFTVLAQEGGAPQLLWPTGARAAPIATLLLLALALAGRSAGEADIHGPRSALPTAPTGGLGDRPTVEAAIEAWLNRDPCVVSLPSGQRIRPLLLLAAEGGGIRAAYWTAAALDSMWSQVAPNCRDIALFSGGASGGAVGMTVARVSSPGSARDQVAVMSGPQALSAGSVGLFVRDTLYAASGVPAPAWGDAAVGERVWASTKTGWVDRAGLIEASWEATVPALQGPFVADSAVPRGPTGLLILTSTSVSTGCRYLVSQVKLDAGQSVPMTRPEDCSSAGQPVAGSLDLLAAYTAREGCPSGLGEVSAATGALMASRFPWVTPSAVLRGCGAFGADQVVDGGYVDNSGLGVLVDLSPRLVPALRAYNGRQPAGAPPVVPIVVYLDNGNGSDRGPGTVKATAEALVPPLTFLRAVGQQNSTPTLLARLGSLLAPGQVGAELGAGNGVPQLVVVHQRTVPEVSAPLGWVLSEQSRTAMDRALRDAAGSRCPDLARADPRGGVAGDYQCALGYATLGDLLTVLRAAD